MAYTLDSNSLGVVSSEKHKKKEDIDQMSFPGSDSEDTFLFGFGGVIRNITITGSYIATSKADAMDTFVIPIEGLVNGAQTSTVVYHSDLYDEGSGEDGNFNVMVLDFDWSYEQGVPFQINYTLILGEGTA